MSNLHNRITQLEKKHTPNPQPTIYVYYHDEVEGYAKDSAGPYFATFDELATAQGWNPGANDTLVSVEYASPQTKVFIPDNGRENSN